MQEDPGAPAPDHTIHLSALFDEIDAEEGTEGMANNLNKTTPHNPSPEAEPCAPTLSHLNEDTAGDASTFSTRFPTEGPTGEETEQDESLIPIRTLNCCVTSEHTSLATAPTTVSVVVSCQSVKLTPTESIQTASTNRLCHRSTSPLTDVEPVMAMETFYQVTPRTSQNKQRQSVQKHKVIQSDIEANKNQPPVQSSKRARHSG